MSSAQAGREIARTFLNAPFANMASGDSPDIGIFGVPFDLGTFYRTGSRGGPAAIRNTPVARPYNMATATAPYELCKIADIGDVALPMTDKSAALAAIESFVSRLAASGTRPLAVGGDHTIPLAVLRGLKPKSPLALITFDAHPDTSDDERGDRYCYSTPFRRAVEEGLVDPKATVMIGLRSGTRSADYYDWPLSVGMRLITMEEFDRLGRQGVAAEVNALVANRPTYLTFDIDALDAAIAPGTGFPEPGGLGFRDCIAIIRSLYGQTLVGADLCEFNPTCDVANLTALTSVHLLFEIACLLARSPAEAQRPSGFAA